MTSSTCVLEGVGRVQTVKDGGGGAKNLQKVRTGFINSHWSQPEIFEKKVVNFCMSKNWSTS